jgi:hypothetical protein
MSYCILFFSGRLRNPPQAANGTQRKTEYFWDRIFSSMPHHCFRPIRWIGLTQKKNNISAGLESENPSTRKTTTATMMPSTNTSFMYVEHTKEEDEHETTMEMTYIGRFNYNTSTELKSSSMEGENNEDASPSPSYQIHYACSRSFLSPATVIGIVHCAATKEQQLS